MTSSSDMDKPAVVLTAIVGLVLIGASLPFLILDGGGGGQRYLIGWSEVEVAENSAPFGAEGATVPVALTTPSALISNVTISLTCADSNPGTPARPATVSWTLREGTRTLGTGTDVVCADDAEVDRINITTHPDVGSVTAGSRHGAEEAAYAAGDNQTRTFTLEFRYDRPDAQVQNPLPVGQPTPPGGRMTVTALAWHATANEPAEVTR